MRKFVTLIALVALMLVTPVLGGCSCGGQPTLTLRNPFAIDTEPATVAGPRMMAVPAYMTPTYTPSASYGCAPGAVAPGAALPPGYSYAPAPR